MFCAFRLPFSQTEDMFTGQAKIFVFLYVCMYIHTYVQPWVHICIVMYVQMRQRVGVVIKSSLGNVTIICLQTYNIILIVQIIQWQFICTRDLN